VPWALIPGRRGEHRAQDFDHAAGRCAGREKSGVTALPVNEIDHARMIDLSVSVGSSCIIDFVRERDALDRARITGQANEPFGIKDLPLA
jgi:hypothetical protein